MPLTYFIEEESTGRKFCVDTADRCWETALRLGWVAGDREAEWQTFPARFENDRCSIIPVDEPRGISCRLIDYGFND